MTTQLTVKPDFVHSEIGASADLRMDKVELISEASKVYAKHGASLMAWSNVGNFLRGSFPLFPGLFTSAAILIYAKTCHNYPGMNAGVDGTSGTIEGRHHELNIIRVNTASGAFYSTRIAIGSLV